jgi:hypothetical protein
LGEQRHRFRDQVEIRLLLARRIRPTRARLARFAARRVAIRFGECLDERL